MADDAPSPALPRPSTGSKPDYLLLDIFLHLRSETWTQWTVEAARVKVHHRPYSLRMVRWCIRLTRLTLVCEVIRYRLVQVRQNLKKKDFSGWRPAIAFLYFFLFHSLLRLTSFLSQYKNKNLPSPTYLIRYLFIEVGTTTPKLKLDAFQLGQLQIQSFSDPSEIRWRVRGAREAPAPSDSLNFQRASLLSRNEFESGTFTIVLHATSSFAYLSVIYGANFPFKFGWG